MNRKAYLLTCDKNSERTISSKKILESIGFEVILFMAIPNEDKVLSNKNSLLQIYKLISEGENEWAYVFEDDINIHEMFDINELEEYEKISKDFYYLGCCVNPYIKNTQHFPSTIIINNRNPIMVRGNIRGHHAIGFSKDGANKLYDFALISKERYMDAILDKYTVLIPTYVYRYDLESYIIGHRGIFFQDEKKFPSIINT